MYSFEGRFKARRQPPYIIEQKNPVQRMQEERRRRALLSRQEWAATVIQAFVRGTRSRRQTNVLLCQQFDLLCDEILSYSGDCSDDITCITSAATCLRNFVFISRISVSDSSVMKMAQVLLTPTCTSLYFQWLAQNSVQDVLTIIHVVSRFLSYLPNLPPASPPQLYSSIVTVLKHYLFKQKLTSNEQVSNNVEGLFLEVCKRGHYFSKIAAFVGRQSRIPENEDSTDAYIRLPENRDLLYLLRAPFSIYLPSQPVLGQSQITMELISIAVDDVAYVALQQDNRVDLPTKSKIVGYILPLIAISIPFNFLVSYLYICACRSRVDKNENSAEGYLQPSLDLLSFLFGALSHFPLESASNSGPLSIQLIHILAWMFSALITARCPADGSTNIFSPPFSPPPLSAGAASSTDDVSWISDDGAVDAVAVPVASNDAKLFSYSVTRQESDVAVLRFIDSLMGLIHKVYDFPMVISQLQIWLHLLNPGQTAEVFDFLQKYFPHLAHAALRDSYETVPSILSDRKSDQVIDCLPVLYSMLAFFRPTASRPLRTLTTSMSHPPQFLHDLWTVATTMPTDSGEGRLFDIIVSKKMSEIPKAMDKFTGVLVTFLNSLHHRLIFLTDAEISAEPHDDSGLNIYGFTPSGLLDVGLRLRDFMLGLIDLLYPPRPPPPARLDGVYVPVTLREVIERVEMQRMSEKGTSTPSSVASANASNELADSEETRLRWCLHRWRTLFLAAQKVVAQIYGWRRRQQRQQEDWPLTPEAAGEPGDSEWLRPAVMSEFNNVRTAAWMVERYLELRDEGLTRAQLGYFSCLNADRDAHKLASMTFLDWRKMTVILEMPFIFPFWDRVKFFVSMIRNFRLSIQDASDPTFISESDRTRAINIQIRREHVYEDAFTSLAGNQVVSFHPRFMVTFYNQAGVVEMGIDGGGLCREMLLEVIRQGFDPSRGLFLCNDDHALYPNPDVAALMEDHEVHYAFLGAILGKAIYEGMVVDLQFAPFFLAKIVSPNKSLSVDFNHLRSLDRELYRQLCRLKTYDGDVRDLELDFTIVQHIYGRNTVVELKPGGASIPVTNSSRVEYINLVANYKLNKQILRQSLAFISGMAKVIDLKWLQLFDAEELQIVISGTHSDIDVDDWIQNTQFIGDMRNEQNLKTITLFWAFVRDLGEDQKRNLIRFVTASSRPPMFGFGFLHPPFTIQLISDTSHYPTASTCMNLLKLPTYQTEDELKGKFLYVIQCNAGFEYS